MRSRSLAGSTRRSIASSYGTRTTNRPGLEPLRRWTVNPSFYMKVTDEAGVTMDGKTLNNTEQVIRAFVPQWTGGKFAVAAFERGTATRPLASGWMNVNWSNKSVPATSGNLLRCGDSDVGRNPGTMNLYYKAAQNGGGGGGGCRCAGQSEMGSRVVGHELGHAMGFWHAGAVNDVMFPGTGNYCDATDRQRKRPRRDRLRPSGRQYRPRSGPLECRQSGADARPLTPRPS